MQLYFARFILLEYTTRRFIMKIRQVASEIGKEL